LLRYHPHTRGNRTGRYRLSVMTVADEAMHLAVREVEEFDRVANAIAPEPRSPQHWVFECHAERRMVRALGLAFAAASELCAFDRRQAPVRPLFEQFDPALQALAARHAHARVNIGLKLYLLQTLVFHARLRFVPSTKKNSRRTCSAFKPDRAPDWQLARLLLQREQGGLETTICDSTLEAPDWHLMSIGRHLRIGVSSR
jgi:hypothetical protein